MIGRRARAHARAANPPSALALSEVPQIGLVRAGEQHRALALVVRERRGALELGACGGGAAEAGEELAADAREQVVALERGLAASSSTISSAAAGP